jgi:hypothetical protein
LFSILVAIAEDSYRIRSNEMVIEAYLRVSALRSLTIKKE